MCFFIYLFSPLIGAVLSNQPIVCRNEDAPSNRRSLIHMILLLITSSTASNVSDTGATLGGSKMSEATTNISNAETVNEAAVAEPAFVNVYGSAGGGGGGGSENAHSSFASLSTTTNLTSANASWAESEAVD